MITILSPAKNLDFKTKSSFGDFSLPLYPEKAKQLIHVLRKLSRQDIQAIMHINPKLADLNFTRYHEWSDEYTLTNARQAILAFNGEVYNGLKARELDSSDLSFAQEHVRILSGMFGVLRPLDLIQPYRLEMGINLSVGKYKNLYDFWGTKILRHLKHLSNNGEQAIVNLASQEYAKAALLTHFKGRVVTPVFKQLKGDKITTIVVYAKKARGLMTRYIIDNRITDPQQLKLFDYEDYFYNENLSTENEWVFTR